MTFSSRLLQPFSCAHVSLLVYEFLITLELYLVCNCSYTQFYFNKGRTGVRFAAPVAHHVLRKLSSPDINIWKRACIDIKGLFSLLITYTQKQVHMPLIPSTKSTQLFKIDIYLHILYTMPILSCSFLPSTVFGMYWLLRNVNTFQPGCLVSHFSTLRSQNSIAIYHFLFPDVFLALITGL